MQIVNYSVEWIVTGDEILNDGDYVVIQEENSSGDQR